MRKFLDVEVTQTSQDILFHKSSYAHSILWDFPNRASQHTLLPESLHLYKDTGIALTNEREYQFLISKLHYLTKTRPELGFSASIASRFMHKPQLIHRQAIQYMLNYIRKHPEEGKMVFPQRRHLT